MRSDNANMPGAVTTDKNNPAEGKDAVSGLPSAMTKSPKRRSAALSGVKMVSFDEMTERTKQATELTTRGITKVTEITGKHVGRALQDTEEVYEKSPWCRLPRFLVQHFPRVFSFLFGVLVPLWCLIGISAGFGILLASYEAPYELESNISILQSRARLNRTFVNTTDLAQLPVECFVEYINQTDRSKFEQRINDYILFTTSSDNSSGTSTNNTTTNISNANMTGFNDTNLVNDTYYTIDDILDETEEDMYRFMLRCQQEQNTETATYLKVVEKDGDSAADSLSFNWNRCWPKKINDEFGDKKAVYFPPDYLIEASRPAQQEATMETEFVRILEESEKECLDLGGEEDECFKQALNEASVGVGGRNVCHNNVEGTSWFFFTIMTTVGYGNQAPVSFEGRILIGIAGIISLILFAAVLGSSGYIITAITDDFVSRLPFGKYIQHPFVGVVLWGGIWISWASAIASGADIWWENRLPDFDVDVEDTFWFAFISTSTIGLGDYFLQPEVMFASDALGFSIIFLVGFVLLSTFLNKIGEFLFEMLPKRESSLETRLKETNLILWTHWPCNDYIRSRLRPFVYHAKDTKRSETDAKESEYSISEQPQQGVEQQVARVEALKSHLPNKSLPPPLNTMCLKGEKNVFDLVDEEVMILKALLESAEQRLTELNRADEESSSLVDVVRMVPLLTGVGPTPSETSERSLSSAISA